MSGDRLIPTLGQRGGHAADRFPEFDGGTARVVHSRARPPSKLRPARHGSCSIKCELGTRIGTARRKSRRASRRPYSFIRSDRGATLAIS